jgi:tetratricopeptide (TPR) repeat protein
MQFNPAPFFVKSKRWQNETIPLKRAVKHKGKKNRWSSMSVIIVGSVFFSGFVIGGFGLWMKKMQNSIEHLVEQNVVLKESQSSHFQYLNSLSSETKLHLEEVTSIIATYLEIHPQVDASMKTHAFLLHYEHSSTISPGVEECLAVLASTLGPCSTDTVDANLNELHQSFVVRLLDVFDRNSISAEGLQLDGHLAHKLGVASMVVKRYDWAEHALGIAYRLSPGHEGILRHLYSISCLRGDEDLQRHWLESLMKVSPDQPDLLRAHAHLLVSMGDNEAERTVRRLEALGVDTPADKSLLSGLRARAGARSEALDAIEKALEQDPSRPDDWLQYGRLLKEEGELLAAIEATEQCLKINRQHGEAWALLAHMLSDDSKRHHEALKAATHAVALDAGGVDTIFLKTELLEVQGELVAAEENLLKSLKKTPQDGELRARIADRFLKAHRIEEAQALVDGTPSNIDHPLLHTVEGRLHLAKADRLRDGTGTTDMRLLQDAKTSFEDALKIHRELGVAWLGLGRTQRLLKDFEIAEESLDRARRLLPENDQNVAAESALLSLDKGDISRASQWIDAADVQGQSPMISYVRGNIAGRMGQLELAHTFYTQALDEDPSHIRARLNRAMVLIALNEGQSAVDDCVRLLSLAPHFTLARLRKGEAHMLQAEWKLALNDFKMVLEVSPQHAVALTKLGATYMALQRPERAEAPLNEALRIDPNHAEAWHQRGLLYLEWGKTENALSDFEAAIRTQPGHLDAHLHIAALYHEQGQFDEAAVGWKNVLLLDPDHMVGKTRLAECEAKLTV